MTKTVNVAEIIGSPLCVNTNDGKKVFDAISDALSDRNITDNLPIEVSFKDIELVIPAFLNAAVGQLCGSLTPKDIKKNITFTYLEPDDVVLLDYVIDNAVRYYRNRKNYDYATQEVDNVCIA